MWHINKHAYRNIRLLYVGLCLQEEILCMIEVGRAAEGTDRGPDRQSDREALPHTHAVNVLSLTVSNSHSQMYYTIYIISNSSRTCSRCFDSPTGTESSDDLICVPLCSAGITMYMLIKYKAIHHSHSMDETKLEYKLSNRSGIVISDLCVLVSVHFSAGASCPCADCSSA